MYSLHKQGPCTVYSGDLEPVNGDASLVIPETSVPIVKLAEGQAILVYAKAKIGTAKQHAKWQTVVAPRFYQAPTLTVAPGKGSKTVIKVVGKEHFKKKGKNQVIEDPVVAHKAIKKTESLWNDEDAKNAMTITRNKTHFILEFETTGAMEAKLALQQALKSLDSHCKDFMTCLDSAT